MKKWPPNTPLSLLLILIIAPLSQAESNKSVGRQLCIGCHTPEQRTVIGTPHDNDKACESCHGPGEQHLKSSDKGSTMFSFRRATAAEVSARCQQCHKNPVMERHATGDVSCISCHSIHHYARRQYLLKADDNLNIARRSEIPSGPVHY
jgi:hypothetical protein